MKTLLLFRCGLGLLAFFVVINALEATRGLAADSDHPVVTGAEALSTRMGDPAAWQMTLETADAGAPSSATPNKGITPEPSTTRADRVHGIIFYVRHAPERDEKYWILKDFVCYNYAGSPGYYILKLQSEDRPYIDFSGSDFPELNWILKMNSSGVFSVKGIQCYRFQQQISSDQADATIDPTSHKSIPAMEVAYIGVSNRLPVQLLIGQEEWNYSYPQPLTQIDIPDEAKKVIEKRRQDFKRNFPRPSLP